MIVSAFARLAMANASANVKVLPIPILSKNYRNLVHPDSLKHSIL